MVGTFHETVTSHLFTILKVLLKPKWLLLAGDFFPRGNVNTTIIFETGKRPTAADFLLKNTNPAPEGLQRREENWPDYL